MTQKKLTIAIDGFSSTGKSTLAKALAKELSYSYVDTGAMYRAVTYFALEKNLFQDFELTDKNALIDELPNLSISFEYQMDEGKSVILLNGRNVEHAIRDMNVSNRVSTVATLPEVRHAMVALQQKMGENGGIVMDGRDIGSVVFPNAELKIFMTANPEVRAKRRFEELKAKGAAVTLQEVYENLQSRDHMDATRAESPLIQVQDARVLDNSQLTQKEQLSLVQQWVQEIQSTF